MNVLVLGAGIVGATIAEYLAVRGADVTLLDMRSPGRGATQASAGILAPFIEGLHQPALLKLATRSLDLFDQHIAGLSARAPAPIEYVRSGTLEVALNSDDRTRLLQAKQNLDRLRIASQWLDGDAVREIEPGVTPSAVSGLLISSHGLVNVASLLKALLHSATAAGASIHSPVEGVVVRQHAGGVDVEAGERKFTADAVVIATGSWSRRVRVEHVAPLPVRPVRGQLLHLQWCDADQPSRVVWGPSCYAVPWADGSLLVGATVEDVGFDEGTTLTGIHGLASAAIELLPHSSGARLEAVRVGLRPVLPDGLPAIGPFPRADRVVVATGHYRNGVLLAPLTAEIVGRYLLDQVTDAMFDSVSPARFT